MESSSVAVDINDFIQQVADAGEVADWSELRASSLATNEQQEVFVVGSWSPLEA